MESNRKQIKRTPKEQMAGESPDGYYRVLGVKNWTTVVMDRSARHVLVETSKTYRGV